MEELTILIPALNEENTIGMVVKKAIRWLNENNVLGEVLIANNGSTDKTKKIAIENGARVIDVKEKGYGAALINGIENAHGKYVILGDADDSYNFLEIDEFYKELLLGADLVIGNRYGKNMEKGSMKFSHKYVGTPMLSFLIRKKYNVKIKDVNCGLRGVKKESFLKLRLQGKRDGICK